MKRRLIVLMLLIAVASCGESARLSSGSRTPPRSSATASQSPTPTAEFDGTIHGWRIAPNAVLEAEFGNDLRNLDLECDAKKVAPSAKTNLDVDLTYFPESAQERGKPSIVKWVCGAQGLSTYYQWDLRTKPFPVVGTTGYLRIDRVVTARRAYHIGTTRADRVSACTVAGFRAVCFRNEPEGHVLILVIEDDVLDPHATVLLVDAEGLPFDELVKMIEGLE